MLQLLWGRFRHSFSLPPDANHHPDVTRFFRRNFWVNIIDMMTWTMGASFVAPTTILTVYASHLTDSAILIGLIPAILEFGAFAPPLLVVPFVEKQKRQFPLVIGLGVFERLPYLFLPLVALWLTRISHDVAIWWLLLFVAWIALGTGLVITPWQEMLAKVIPVSHRGRLFGVGFFLGRLLGIAVTPVVAYILARYGYPQNFIISFAIANIGIWASLIFLLFNKEPISEPVIRPANKENGYLQRLGAMLTKQPNFRFYLISRWLIQLGRTPFTFMAIYAVQRYSLPDSSAAFLTGILYATGMAGYAIWGAAGDKWGHKRVLELSTILWMVALVLAPLTGLWSGMVYLAMALMGFSDAGHLMSNLSLPLEFSSEADRPMIVSLTRTIIGPTLLIGPLFGGWVIETWGYTELFAVALVMTIAGWLVLNYRVEEPRHIKLKRVESSAD
jgi:MFS family permease